MIVTFTVNNRPAYLKATLDSWRRARGVGGVSALFVCEPGCFEAVRMCEEADFFWHSSIIVLQERGGVLVTPWIAFNQGFAMQHDFVVLAEEDIIVSQDAVEYLSWGAEEFRDDERVLAVTTHQPLIKAGGLGAVYRERRFGGWVWGTWPDRWAEISPDWDKDYRHRGWDHRLNDYWCGELGYHVAAPAIARSQHIGRDGGTHCTPAMFEGLLCPGFTEEVPPQRYARFA